MTRTPLGSNSARNCSSVGRGRAVRRCVSAGRAELDEAVDGDDRTVGLDDQRVDVDARHVRSFGSQTAESDDDVDELGAVDRGLAAERAEQLLGREVVDHLRRGDRVDRGRTEHDVGDRFGEDATDAEHHRRAELRIAHHSGDQLAVAGDHRCDQDGDVAVGRRRCGEQLGGGCLDGRPVGQTELHQPAFGLVSDRVTVQLGHDGVPEFVGRRPGRRRVVDDTFGSDRNAVVGEQGLGVALGQRRVRVGAVGGRLWGRHAVPKVPLTRHASVFTRPPRHRASDEPTAPILSLRSSQRPDSASR